MLVPASLLKSIYGTLPWLVTIQLSLLTRVVQAVDEFFPRIS